jgi:hypothetical protein
VAIEVIQEGSGPLVVLLPSLGRDSEEFDPIAAEVAAARKPSGRLTQVWFAGCVRTVTA